MDNDFHKPDDAEQPAPTTSSPRDVATKASVLIGGETFAATVLACLTQGAVLAAAENAVQSSQSR